MPGVGATLAALTILTTISTVTVVLPAGSTAADQVSVLKAQAARITQDLVLEQLQISTFRQQYDVDTAKVQRDKVEIESSGARIQADITRVGHDRKRLQSEVVSAYINVDPEVSGIGVLFEDQKNAPTRTEYEEVASGNIALAIDALHTDEAGLRAAAPRSNKKKRATRRRPTRRRRWPTRPTRPRSASPRSSRRSRASWRRRWPSNRRHRPRPRQRRSGPHRQRRPRLRRAQAQAQAQAAAATARAAKPTTSTPAAPQGFAAAPPSGDPQLPPFLQCVLQAESGGNYGAVSPGGTYMGGFQFSQSTWNQAAVLAGMPQLINVPPNEATPAEQDDLAIALYDADGQQPWNNSCRSS